MKDRRPELQIAGSRLNAPIRGYSRLSATLK